ncbi:MAG: hypothetical protein GX957_11245, partial [Clostridiaceae bacterium]|nr:hypothetical protein [Clostridiaceae bacterium]
MTINSYLIDDVIRDIPVSEYKSRVQRTQKEMAKENYDMLIIYSNPWHMSNVFWLSN